MGLCGANVRALMETSLHRVRGQSELSAHLVYRRSSFICMGCISAERRSKGPDLIYEVYPKWPNTRPSTFRLRLLDDWLLCYNLSISSDRFCLPPELP